MNVLQRVETVLRKNTITGIILIFALSLVINVIYFNWSEAPIMLPGDSAGYLSSADKLYHHILHHLLGMYMSRYMLLVLDSHHYHELNPRSHLLQVHPDRSDILHRI